MFQATSSTLIVGLLIGAVLAMVLSSSAASIGLILTLAATGALPVVAALALMLGANVGTTLTALLSSLQEGTLAGRRWPWFTRKRNLLARSCFSHSWGHWPHCWLISGV